MDGVQPVSMLEVGSHLWGGAEEAGAVVDGALHLGWVAIGMDWHATGVCVVLGVGLDDV